MRGSHGQRVAISKPEIRSRPQPPRHGRIHGPRRSSGRQRSHGIVLLAAPEERPRSPFLGHPRRPADRDRDLDRTDLPPPPTTSRARPIDPDRVRSHHDHASQSGCVTNHCHRSVQQSQPLIGSNHGTWALRVGLSRPGQGANSISNPWFTELQLAARAGQGSPHSPDGRVRQLMDCTQGGERIDAGVVA